MSSRNIEDAYPLSPMQEGLLFHSLYAPEHVVYISHLTCTLKNLEVAAFERPWQRVMDRHPVLRPAFVWETLKKPLQVVGRHVRLTLEQHDWRELSGDEFARRWEEYLAQAR